MDSVSRPSPMRLAIGLLLGAVALPSCAAQHDLRSSVALLPAATPGRWRSALLRFAVPPGSRCVAVQVSGDRDTRYALSSLRVGDREFLSPSLAETPTAEPREQTFSLVYPFAPGQPAPAGPIALVIEADRGPGAAQVRVLAPPDNGAHVLHLNLFSVSLQAAPGDAALWAAMLAAAQAILDQAGLRLRVDGRFALPGNRWANLDEGDAGPGSPATPRGPAAALAAHGAALAHNGALNVYLVDRLPPGEEGRSLGVPGPFSPVPPSAGSSFGVVLRRGDGAALGRALAHELAHYLGLPHVRTITPDGIAHEDALPDTQPGSDNLMEHGTHITAGQAFVLSRSPLLRPD